MLISIGKASILLCASIPTLKIRENQGRIKPHHRTLGGHRMVVIEHNY